MCRLPRKSMFVFAEDLTRRRAFLIQRLALGDVEHGRGCRRWPCTYDMTMPRNSVTPKPRIWSVPTE